MMTHRFPAILCFFILTICGSTQLAAQAYPGYTLYGPNGTRYNYLIDMANTRVHTWTSSRKGGYAVYLLPDGSIMRTAMATNPQLNAGGAQGVVQRIAWDGTLLWEYTYSSAAYLSHHDICIMPNGNVLMIAWEVKSTALCVAAGLDHSASIWPDHIIEVQPTGSNGGNIVWQWHAWDHLIQDHDASKANYGVVGDHPELLDINAGNVYFGDWMHLNSIDYNPELDQIVVSSHNLNEVYVIDHSTTTAQAAGHTGGNSGKGGDILYRWGNPANYRASGNAYFDVVHCGSWIPAGLPGAGNILAFNNRAKSGQSIIAEIATPLSGYNYTRTAGQAFGPAAPSWTYTGVGFYSQHLGGVQRLPNGNTLIAQSTSGKMLEVNTGGTIVWNYSPGGEVVRAYRYAANYPGILLGGGTPKVSKVEVSPATVAWPVVTIPFRVTCQDTVRYGLDKSWFTILENGAAVASFTISCPGSGTGMCSLSYTSSCPDGSQRSLSIRFSGYCALDTTIVQTVTMPDDTAAFTPIQFSLRDVPVVDLDQATVALDLLDTLANQAITPATFEIHFDRTLCEFESVSIPPLSLLDGMQITSSPTVEGMSFTVTPSRQISGSGKLADFVFRKVAKGSLVHAPLHLTNWTFAPGCVKALLGDGSATFESTPRMTISVPDVDFGIVEVGSIKDTSLLITNTGTAGLLLSGQTIAGTDAGQFSLLTAASSPIFSAQSSSAVLRFAPTAAGLKTSIFQLSSNDPLQPQRDISMRGVGSVPNAVEQPALILGMQLDQNFPNPFGPASPSGSSITTVAYRLDAASNISLTIHDLYGRLVGSLVNGEKEPGVHTESFSAGALPAGIYICRLVSAGRTQTRTVVLLR
ncbi:MAG: aryl-sulfate sulfotransferase [Bacteroidota bacterium]|jgi:hypothetical protein